MPAVSKKISYFTDSVIRRMTRISNRFDAINLSQGFPDFDPENELKEALARSALDGPHQYSITWGAPNFRRALAEKQRKFMGIDIDPEKNIVVTCGSTEAMMAATSTVCDPGDKVIIFSPFYENYIADTILYGSIPVFVTLYPPDFNYKKEELVKAFEDNNPKAIILCNPSNPSGKVFKKEELEFIASLAVKYDSFIITDEVYEHIVYEPDKHVYMASLPGMFDRTISCSSLSKTYSITGWRLGYIIANEAIIDGARKVHDFLTVGAASPLQEAAVVGLKFGDAYYDDLREKYTKMKDFFLSGLKDIGLKYSEPRGAYYVMVDIGEYNDKKDDLEFAEWLIENIGVAGVPGSTFFREPVNNYIRFHFAKKIETLDKALVRLNKLKNYRLH